MKTGAMINIHPGRNEQAPLECIKILTDAVGSNILSRVVISHIDRTVFDSDMHRTIANTGAVLEFGTSSYCLFYVSC